MNQEQIFKLMHKSSSYPHSVKKIQSIQTHISYVFLTGDIAYKRLDKGYNNISDKDWEFIQNKAVIINGHYPRSYRK